MTRDPRESRAADYIEHMREAIRLTATYTEGMSKVEFLRDRRTQQAVILNLIVLGEAASKLSEEYPAFVNAHEEIPWRKMRGMRNRMAHGYFDINLDVVWDHNRYFAA